MTIDEQYDELKSRREKYRVEAEDERLQAEIKRLEAIPLRTGLIAGGIAAVITSTAFPFGITWLLKVVVISFIVGLIAFGVAYFIAYEDIRWCERRRSELRRPLQKTEAA